MRAQARAQLPPDPVGLKPVSWKAAPWSLCILGKHPPLLISTLCEHRAPSGGLVPWAGYPDTVCGLLGAWVPHWRRGGCLGFWPHTEGAALRVRALGMAAWGQSRRCSPWAAL